MSVIIRLQGLPWSASALDIRNFFQGLNIPAGGVHIIGGDKGDAFIAFSTDEDARQAMMKNFDELNGSPIQLLLSSKTEMQNVIEQARTGQAPGPILDDISLKGELDSINPFDPNKPFDDSYGRRPPQDSNRFGEYPANQRHDFRGGFPPNQHQDFKPNFSDNRGNFRGGFLGDKAALHGPQEDYQDMHLYTEGGGCPPFDKQMQDVRGFQPPDQMYPPNRHTPHSQHQPDFHHPDFKQKHDFRQPPDQTNQGDFKQRPDNRRPDRRGPENRHAPDSRRLQDSRYPHDLRPDSQYPLDSRQPTDSRHTPDSRHPPVSRHSQDSRNLQDSKHQPDSRNPQNSRHGPDLRNEPRPDQRHHSDSGRFPPSSRRDPSDRQEVKDPYGRRDQFSRRGPQNMNVRGEFDLNQMGFEDEPSKFHQGFQTGPGIREPGFLAGRDGRSDARSRGRLEQDFRKTEERNARQGSEEPRQDPDYRQDQRHPQGPSDGPRNGLAQRQSGRGPPGNGFDQMGQPPIADHDFRNVASQQKDSAKMDMPPNLNRGGPQRKTDNFHYPPGRGTPGEGPLDMGPGGFTGTHESDFRMGGDDFQQYPQQNFDIASNWGPEPGFQNEEGNFGASGQIRRPEHWQEEHPTFHEGRPGFQPDFSNNQSKGLLGDAPPGLAPGNIRMEQGERQGLPMDHDSRDPNQRPGMPPRGENRQFEGPYGGDFSGRRGPQSDYGNNSAREYSSRDSRMEGPRYRGRDVEKSFDRSEDLRDMRPLPIRDQDRRRTDAYGNPNNQRESRWHDDSSRGERPTGDRDARAHMTARERYPPEHGDLDSVRGMKRGRPSDGGLCIKLRNMPFSTGYRDVRRFLTTCEIPYDGLKMINDDRGRRTGTAYLKFNSEEETWKALQFNGSIMNGRNVIVQPCSLDEFENAVDSYLPPDREMMNTPYPPKRLRAEGNSGHEQEQQQQQNQQQQQHKQMSELPSQPPFFAALKGLPPNVTKEDLLKFLTGVQVARNGEAVYIEYDYKGMGTGLAFVEVQTVKDLNTALGFEGHHMGPRIIRVSVGKKEDVNSFIAHQSNMRKSNDSRPSKNDNRPNTMRSPERKTPDQSHKSQQPTAQQSPKTDSKKSGSSEKERSQKSESAQGSKKETTKEEQVSPDSSGNTDRSNSGSGDSNEHFCVHLTNLPILSTNREIRDFCHGLQVAERGIQICHDGAGKPLGEAFVEFVNKESCAGAVSRDQQTIGPNSINVKAISKSDMIARLRHARSIIAPLSNEAAEMSASLKPIPPGVLKRHWFYLRCSNLPLQVTIREILGFFRGYNPVPESIRLHYTGDGNPTGNAVVGFLSREDAQRAMHELNNTSCRRNVVVIQPASF